MPIVAQVADAMFEVAALKMALARGAGNAQSAKNVCEALSIGLGTADFHPVLLATLLGASDLTIDGLRVGAINSQTQIVRTNTGERRLPLIASDALLKSTGSVCVDVDWMLAQRRIDPLRLLRRRFEDLIVLAGLPPDCAYTAMKRLSGVDEVGHRLCTIIDVVSLVVCDASMPSQRCEIARRALRAVVVSGWHYGAEALIGIARAIQWDAHPVGMQVAIESLAGTRSAREKLAARGVLRELLA